MTGTADAGGFIIRADDALHYQDLVRRARLAQDSGDRALVEDLVDQAVQVTSRFTARPAAPAPRTWRRRQADRVAAVRERIADWISPYGPLDERVDW